MKMLFLLLTRVIVAGLMCAFSTSQAATVDENKETGKGSEKTNAREVEKIRKKQALDSRQKFKEFARPGNEPASLRARSLAGTNTATVTGPAPDWMLPFCRNKTGREVKDIAEVGSLFDLTSSQTFGYKHGLQSIGPAAKSHRGKLSLESSSNDHHNNNSKVKPHQKYASASFETPPSPEAVPAPQISALTFSGPIVITKGGTYVGNWESKNATIPAVEIRTGEPVIIVNSNIRHAGLGIASWGYGGVNLTVRNTSGYGLAPTVKGRERRFVNIGEFKHVVVENCYMEGTAGILIATQYRGNGTSSETVKIRFNKAKNIDGRIYGGKVIAQFVQFNYRGNLPYAEIAWNEVINEPNNSAVEDNININNSRGKATSPIRIHDNYIQGAYPIPANGTSYSGGGILMDGSKESTVTDCSAYIEAYGNHLVNPGNYSMGIASGHHIRYHHNRAVNSATFNDGTRFNMYTSGFWSQDYYNTKTNFSNVIDYNAIGVVNWAWTGGRRDTSVMKLVSFTNNTFLPNPITKQKEKDEYTRWLQKVQQNGIIVGLKSAPAAPATGKITREYWANVTTESINDIPVSSPPATTSDLTLFEAPSNAGDNYGQRVRGYITAPATGQYTFWIASDNHSELWLSTSEDPARKVKIAYVNGRTNPREWNKFTTQRSAAVRLEAGKRYYLEALHVEGLGGDNLAVGWALPGGVLERPIPGNRLTPFNSTTTIATSVSAVQRADEEAYSATMVYPNPFQDKIALILGEQDAVLEQVVLLNQNGQVVFTPSDLNLKDNKLILDLASLKLNPGLYFLKYTDSKRHSHTIKLIKE